MTIYHQRRAAFTFTVLLLAGMTLGAPVALAANPPHAQTRHVAWTNAQPQGTVGEMAPHSPVMESHVDDPFTSLHQE
jgi:hypothetical protein